MNKSCAHKFIPAGGIYPKKSYPGKKFRIFVCEKCLFSMEVVTEYYDIIHNSELNEHIIVIAEQFINHFGKDNIPQNFYRSVRTFTNSLPVNEVSDYLNKSISKLPDKSNDCFQYFCKVCWNNIKDNFTPILRERIEEEDTF